MPAKGTQTAKGKPLWKEQWFGTLAQWAAFCGVLAVFIAGKVGDHASQDFGLRVDVLTIPMVPRIAEVSITVAPDWIVHFRCNHDGQELTCSIDNLKKGKAERFPELLLDPRLRKTSQWEEGQWWLHSSYNLCEGNGQFNVYRRNGVFLCSKEKPGWRANHFPLEEGEEMEIHVSLAKLGIVPGQRFGLAFDVTDTQSNWNFWPLGAKLESPATWAEAELSPVRTAPNGHGFSTDRESTHSLTHALGMRSWVKRR